MKTMNQITMITVVLALSFVVMPAATLLAEGEPTAAPTPQPVAEVPADQVVIEPVEEDQMQPTTTEDMIKGPLGPAEGTDRDNALRDLRLIYTEVVITNTRDAQGYIYRETEFRDENGGLIVTVIDHHGTANDYNTNFRYPDGSSDLYDRFGHKVRVEEAAPEAAQGSAAAPAGQEQEPSTEEPASETSPEEPPDEPVYSNPQPSGIPIPDNAIYIARDPLAPWPGGVIEIPPLAPEGYEYLATHLDGNLQAIGWYYVPISPKVEAVDSKAVE